MVYTLDAWSNMRSFRYALPVNVVAWSPNGVYLACGLADQTIHVQNVLTHTLVGIYRGHTQPISALSWSPDNQRIVSGSFSATTINIWDALTGLGILSYHAHAGSVLSVAWSFDGRSILSGGSDRKVCIWQAP